MAFKIKVFLLLLALVSSSPIQASTYWICKPQAFPKNDPSLLFTPIENSSKVLLVMEQDFVRQEGKWPAGQYEGTIKLSSSGFSKFVQFDVEKYFPNHLSGKQNSYFSMSLSVKQNVFVSEAYLIFPSQSSNLSGTILNEYACWAK